MKNNNNLFAFGKENYIILLIGLAINILGFMLMIGGGSSDPNNFDPKELFSPVRLTLSPILVVSGYIVMLYAIMKKPKSKVSGDAKAQSRPDVID